MLHVAFYQFFHSHNYSHVISLIIIIIIIISASRATLLVSLLRHLAHRAQSAPD